MVTNFSESPKPTSPNLRIGTAPVNWNNNDLPGWRPEVPFPEILDQMKAAGYAATEWDQSFGTEIAILNHERLVRGISFSGAYRWLDFNDDRQFERDLAEISPFLETLQGIDAHHLIVSDVMRPHRIACAGSVPSDCSVSLDERGYDRLAANLARLSEAVTPYNLRLHYHNHVGSYIETPFELDALLQRLDLEVVDLCFDTGHYAFGGGDSLAFLAQNMPAIGYLHLKDVDSQVLATAKAERWSFLEALKHYVFCPLGEGNAKVTGILETLRKSKFAHYVIIEQDTCRGDATETALQNLSVATRIATLCT